jgi:DNA-binding transcriptional MerR regulator
MEGGMTTKIPDKLYFKIGEVAKLAEVPAHVLRYWESEFPNIRPKRANSQQRLYRYQDVELVLKIKTLLHDQGYTIAGARKFLETKEVVEEPVKQPAVSVKSTTSATKLREIKEELNKLKALLNRGVK